MVGQRFCPQCGTRNESDAAFCESCGHQIARPAGPSAPVQQEMSPAKSRSRPWLLMSAVALAVLVGVAFALQGQLSRVVSELTGSSEYESYESAGAAPSSSPVETSTLVNETDVSAAGAAQATAPSGGIALAPIEDSVFSSQVRSDDVAPRDAAPRVVTPTNVGDEVRRQAPPGAQVDATRDALDRAMEQEISALNREAADRARREAADQATRETAERAAREAADRAAREAADARQEDTQRALATSPAAPIVAVLEVPSGTEMSVRLSTELNSGKVKVEDRFEATTTDNVTIAGRTAIPAGSVLRGVVSSVEPATRTNRTARMTLAFDQVTIQGQRYPIRGMLTEELRGSGLRGETTRIVTGAGIGAILGGILGGAKGAGIGAAVGGGGTVAATEGNEIQLPAGSVLRVRLDSPLSIR